MDTTPQPTPVPLAQPAAPDPVELEERVDSLQRMIGTVLVLMLIISGTLSVFLYYQVRIANRELEAGRQQLNKVEVQQNEIIKRMTDFGRAHTDFAPILAKYGVKPDAATGAVPFNASSPGAPPKK